MRLLRSNYFLLLLIYLLETVPKNCDGNLIYRRRSRSLANKSGYAVNKVVAKENMECVNECCKNCIDKCVLKDANQNNKSLEILQNNRSLGLDQNNKSVGTSQNNKTFDTSNVIEHTLKLSKRKKSVDNMIKLRNDKSDDKWEKSPNDKFHSCRSSRIIRTYDVIDQNNKTLSNDNTVFNDALHDKSNKTLAKLAKKFKRSILENLNFEELNNNQNNIIFS